VTAYLGLGSNLGDREANLARAVERLRAIDADLRVSPVYETAPVGGPPQGLYLNCVVALETTIGPKALLRFAKQLEFEAHRVRTVRNGPRTLDVDLLILDDLVVADDELTLPHPRMTERAFVLAPLEDLDPSAVPAGWRERLGQVEEQVRKVGMLVSG
jgi:2-amino-4-hydroxy-6-hydroxymethyldihydropteridine diphosphokinase